MSLPEDTQESQDKKKEEYDKMKQEHEKKVAEQEQLKAELIKRQNEFEAQLDQKYLSISKAAKNNAQYLVMAGSYYPMPLKKIELFGNVVNSECTF